MRTLRAHLLLSAWIWLVLSLAAAQTPSDNRAVCFHQRVTWKAGGDTWTTMLSSPNGVQRYRLALVPWHGTEGGIWIEIQLTRPNLPRKNLLNPGKWRRAPAYVIRAEDIENPEKSQFAATRVFLVGRAKLRVVIVGSVLSHGYGLCSGCPDIQELTLDLTMGTE